MDLHGAARNGDVTAVKRCLDSGVDVNKTSISGDTALHEATRHNQPAVVRCLLERGADTEVKPPPTGMTPLVEAAHTNHTAVIRELLAGGAQVNGQAGGGDTPIKRAAWGGHKESVEVLLEAGADPKLSNDQGWTPLHESSMLFIVLLYNYVLNMCVGSVLCYKIK